MNEWYVCGSCDREVHVPNDPSPREADCICCECAFIAEAGEAS